MNDVARQIDAGEVIEGIEETTRKLASIQRIVAITPIPNADRIEVVQILGWQCVVKKSDGFKIGDLVVYFEVDSILPQLPDFEFLRERKFRIRTIKLRKQVSEGLVMPLSILHGATEFIQNPTNMQEGIDVTKILGVTKHDPEGKLEQALVEKEKQSPIMKALMGIPLFRKVYLKLNDRRGAWPEWVTRTDETRIQVCAKKMIEHYNEEWEITEKLDGQSATFFLHPMKVWGRRKPTFGVCSRKIWLKKPSDNKYWSTAKKLDLEAKFSKESEWYLKRQISEQKNPSIVTQGEQCGPGIQGNRYKLPETDLYVFNVDSNRIRYRHDLMADFCKDHGLKTVPLIAASFIPFRDIGPEKSVAEVVAFMVKMSQGQSLLLPEQQREGIVCRLKSEPRISLKVINPEFKMKQEEEEDAADATENESTS